MMVNEALREHLSRSKIQVDRVGNGNEVKILMFQRS